MESILSELKALNHLTEAQVSTAVDFLIDESADSDCKKSFLSLLNDKGETPDELTYFAQAFLEHAVTPEFDINRYQNQQPVIDVCGTGGDHLNLFNVSTTSMFVLAEAGAIVVKHGNKGVTSKSGSSDVLQALGIRADLPPEQFGSIIDQAGVGFLWAPLYHPAFKAIMPVRMELAQEGKKTLFNLMGPLLNPIRPTHQLIGVYREDLVQTFANILSKLGRKKAWVVHGTTEDNRVVDEMSLFGNSVIAEVNEREVSKNQIINPRDLGLEITTPEETAGGSPQENAEMLISILQGKLKGPKADLVALNSAAAMVAADLVPTLETGLQKAKDILNSGSAFQRLERLQHASK